MTENRDNTVPIDNVLAGVLLFLGARRRGDDIYSDEEQEDLENEGALEERGGVGEDPRLWPQPGPAAARRWRG